ncbi:MAG TPA: hypothetical protein DD490_03380 [Acidobacteria bacterium]|nr:hypothetical protein [Acidobacteriota bacterium]
MRAPRFTSTTLLAAGSLLLLAATPKGPLSAPQDPAEVRRELTLLLNQERQLAGVPPLAPSSPLQQVAQERAEEIQSQGALPDEAEAMGLFAKVQAKLKMAGYAAHGWTESLTTAPNGLAAAVSAWKREDPTFAQAMDIDYRHAGVGVARLGGHPLYVLLFAWPRSEYFARETTGLADLEAVRRDMLQRVNAIRQGTGLKPLELDPRLNTAAQIHAADMLARSYYNHSSPEGTTPAQRVKEAGFVADMVAENIAAGHTSVADALEAWMHSAGHRRNLLDPRLTHLGVGMALGSYDHRYRVLWVQCFARQQVNWP